MNDRFESYNSVADAGRVAAIDDRLSWCASYACAADDHERLAHDRIANVAHRRVKHDANPQNETDRPFRVRLQHKNDEDCELEFTAYPAREGRSPAFFLSKATNFLSFDTPEHRR